MRSKVSKIDSKTVLKRVKDGKPQKTNFTFRFDDKLMERFKRVCDKEGVKMTAVLEELIQGFLGDLD